MEKEVEVPRSVLTVPFLRLRRDEDAEIVVLTDRSVGGTSLQSGQLEIMLHRRCLHDDAFGE